MLSNRHHSANGFYCHFLFAALCKSLHWKKAQIGLAFTSGSAFEIADVAHRDRPALATYPVHDVHRGGERVTRAKRVVSAILGAREDECARVAIEQASDSENVNAVS